MTRIALALAISCLMFSGCSMRHHHGDCGKCNHHKECSCDHCNHKEQKGKKESCGEKCGKSCGEMGKGECKAKQ